MMEELVIQLIVLAMMFYGGLKIYTQIKKEWSKKNENKND